MKSPHHTGEMVISKKVGVGSGIRAKATCFSHQVPDVHSYAADLGFSSTSSVHPHVQLTLLESFIGHNSSHLCKFDL
jgi:hypothetical protein